jgi:hypothetical protein
VDAGLGRHFRPALALFPEHGEQGVNNFGHGKIDALNVNAREIQDSRAGHFRPRHIELALDKTRTNGTIIVGIPSTV